jgi:hypothetical protein
MLNNIFVAYHLHLQTALSKVDACISHVSGRHYGVTFRRRNLFLSNVGTYFRKASVAAAAAAAAAERANERANDR